MKYLDEVDIELVNQELNFHTNDDSLVIKGGCDLFTTKPIASDKKLYKTIDKHLTQIIQDNEMSRAIEKERKNSINSIFGTSPISPDLHSRSRHGSVNERRASVNTNDTSLESIDDSPFGSLKVQSTKWTFANLIAILNMTFPDHDFSTLQPTTENFTRLKTCDELTHRFNNIMVSLGKNEETLNWVWDRIDSYMNLLPKGSPFMQPNEGSSGRRMSNSNNAEQLECQIFEFVPSDQSIIEDMNYPYQTMWSCYWFIYNKKKKKVAFLYLTAINKVHYSAINGNRKISFRSSRNFNKSDIIINDDEDVLEDASMDEYDEEVLIDDESDMDDIQI